MSNNYPMYINGEWADCEQKFEVLNPATEQVIARVACAGAYEVNHAVASAKKAFKAWRKLPVDSRAEYLHQAAAKINANTDEIAQLLTEEQGKPLAESIAEVQWTAKTITYYAELAKNELGRMAPPIGDTQLNLIIKEPYGVVGAIVPFNYPLLLLMWKAAPALMMGNTLVIKPSELTPLSTLKLIELCFDELPAGVVNCTPGLPEAGKTLVANKDVPVIAFTGSTQTGTNIIRQSADMNKKLHLEMGGKDGFVIDDDVDINDAAAAIAWSGFFNNGQVCTSTERVYVPRAKQQAFIDALVKRVQTLKVGDGMEQSTDLGPMISANGHAKIDAHVEDAIANGATLELGGQGGKPFDQGYFYQPTIVSNVNHDMACMKEETFGPFVAVMPYDTFEQAIDLVNDSPYGLGAVCRTANPLRAKQFYEEVKAGTIWINDPLPDNIAAPFGGMKMSGNSRELGKEGLDAFAEIKHVHWELDLSPKEHWVNL